MTHDDIAEIRRRHAIEAELEIIGKIKDWNGTTSPHLLGQTILRGSLQRLRELNNLGDDNAQS